MVEMVNRMTGTSMLVAEDRVPEYLQQGHALARKQVKEIKKVPEKAPEKAPVVEPEKKPEKAVEDQPKTVEQVDQVEKPVKAKTGRTRAKKKLYIIHTKNRMLYGRTSYNPISRFVSEIPSSLIYRDAPARRNDSYSSFGGYGSTQTRSAFAPSTTTKSAGGFGSVGDKVTIGKTFSAPLKKGSTEQFSEGDRVSHMTFGEGEILSVKPMGADVLYEISFEKVGTKKLMATYAKLKKIN